MKDDPDFNIYFVSIIEKHPCLYDYTKAEYSNKNMQDNAWEDVAIELTERVQDCKERWKNLRGCYTRYLKTLTRTAEFGGKSKKPYYLADHLQFLHPFTKTRKSQNNASYQSLSSLFKNANDFIDHLNAEPDVTIIEDTSTTGGDDTSNDLVAESNVNSNLKAPSSLKLHKTYKYPVSIADVNTPSTLECFKLKQTSVKDLQSDNPDLAFFKSILPDMKDMDNDQKRRFKIGILNLACQILNEDEQSPSATSSSTTNTL